MKWIAFSDQIPKDNQKIKVKSENFWEGEGVFQDGKFIFSSLRGKCFGDPTHWMPLHNPKKS